MDDAPSRNPIDAMGRFFFKVFDIPVTWFRETIVVPNQQKYYYYHRKYQRVPTVDQCYENDAVCLYEANCQFKRDRSVDEEIVHLLRRRLEDCYTYENIDAEQRCKKIYEDYDTASLNYFIKYGDLGKFACAKNCYLKQKHRMVWERREAEGKNIKKLL